jgi:hypothetical protein
MNRNKISDHETTAGTLVEECVRLKIPLQQISFNENIEIEGNGFYIINLGESGRGTHWTGFYKNDDVAIYFDSFGLPPPVEIEEQTEGLFAFNPYIIQDRDEGYCGSYVIEFCQYMNEKRGDPLTVFTKFLNLFKGNVKLNKHILRELEKN